jgi:branched-chain amino acid transport system permease protein
MSDFINIIAVGVLLGGIYALVSVGLNLIFGVIRVVNFAQGEFVMLGMYATYAAYAFLNLDPYLALFLVLPAVRFEAAAQRLPLAPLSRNCPCRSSPPSGCCCCCRTRCWRSRAARLQRPVLGGAVHRADRPGPDRPGPAHARQPPPPRGGGLEPVPQAHLSRQGHPRRGADRRAAPLMGINVERVYMVTFGIGTALPVCRLPADADLHPVAADRFHPASLAVVVLPAWQRSAPMAASAA